MKGLIRNIVLAGPEGTWGEERWEGPPRAHAAFYAELLGMRIIREDWLVIAKDESTLPRIAFGDGPTPGYRPPRWPDPEHPQQAHLDISVNDADAAGRLVLGLGGTLLQDKGAWRSYADPVGHPFCLYPDPGQGEAARVSRVVFDCFSPRALAGFYADLLDMRARPVDSPERVEIARPDDPMPSLVFQHAVFEAPRWPDPAYPQQLHLDLHFDDQEAAQELAERLGAIRMPKGGSCPVYSDPAAHPFCLCAPGQ